MLPISRPRSARSNGVYDTMIFFIALTSISFGAIVALCSWHRKEVKNLTQDELTQLVEQTPSIFHEIGDVITPIGAKIFRRSSFMMYHTGEWVIKIMREKLVYIENRLRHIADYLHGRKIFLVRNRPSPFWNSLHEWKNGRVTPVLPESRFQRNGDGTNGRNVSLSSEFDATASGEQFGTITPFLKKESVIVPEFYNDREEISIQAVSLIDMPKTLKTFGKKGNSQKKTNQNTSKIIFQ